MTRTRGWTSNDARIPPGYQTSREGASPASLKAPRLTRPAIPSSNEDSPVQEVSGYPECKRDTCLNIPQRELVRHAFEEPRLAGVACVACWWLLAGVAGSGERPKRELRFPKGGSFVVAVALASVLPKGPTDGFVHVLEFDLGFPFPGRLNIEKAQAENKVWNEHRRGGLRRGGSVGKKKHRKRSRGQRDLKESQRQRLLLQMEDAITRGGFDGPSCVSRFQCELRHISPNSSLLEELLSVLFTSSRADDDECGRVHLHCPISLLHVMMHSEQVSFG